MTVQYPSDIQKIMDRLEELHARIPAQLVKNVHPGIALVLDPDDEARAALTQVLELMGFRVFAVSTLEEARKTSDSLRDLSIAVAVPRPDAGTQRTGIEFLSHLRERNPKLIPILAVSFAESEDAVGALRQNILGFFIKPYDRAEVMRNLSELLYLYDRTNYLVRLLADVDRILSEWRSQQH